MSGKKRSANFSSKEESLLISLAKKYGRIIECKKTDACTHHSKNKCWEDIEKEFNTISGEVFRSKEVLRKKYDNLKKNVKKKYANEKCYSQGTGGGPPKEEVFTQIEKDIKEILGTRIEGMTSEFDGDVQSEAAAERLDASVNKAIECDLGFLEDITYTIDDCQVLVDHQHCKELEATDVEMSNAVREETPSTSNNQVSKKWTVGTPKRLRTRKSSVLDASRAKKTQGADVSTKINQWAAAKSAVEESRQKFLEEEQKLRLQMLKEKHEEELRLYKEKAELEMKLLEEAHRIKIKHQEEEHRLKIEILLLQKNKLK